MSWKGVYEKETELLGTDLVLGEEAATGKTIIIPLDSLTSFVRNYGLSSSFGIFSDSASESSDVSVDIITTGIRTFDPVRLDFLGSLQDTTYLPPEMGAILINQEVAPASSTFDFRSLEIGKRLRFSLLMEVSLRTQAGGVWTDDNSYTIESKFTFPSGRIDSNVATVASPKDSSDSPTWTLVKFDFSEYIKEDGVDNLIGGSLGVRLFNDLIQVIPTSPQLFYRNVRVIVES